MTVFPAIMTGKWSILLLVLSVVLSISLVSLTMPTIGVENICFCQIAIRKLHLQVIFF